MEWNPICIIANGRHDSGIDNRVKSIPPATIILGLINYIVWMNHHGGSSVIVLVVVHFFVHTTRFMFVGTNDSSRRSTIVAVAQCNPTPSSWASTTTLSTVVVAYSAHDSTLIGLLRALRLEQRGQRPGYTSCFKIELLQVTPRDKENNSDDEPQYWVRCSLNNERLK